jgi:hypothetical protein
MFLWMMDDETYRRRREAFVRADHSGYAPVTGQADPKAKEPASFDTKSHVDDRQTRCQEDWGDVSDGHVESHIKATLGEINRKYRNALDMIDPRK